MKEAEQQWIARGKAALALFVAAPELARRAAATGRKAYPLITAEEAATLEELLVLSQKMRGILQRSESLRQLYGPQVRQEPFFEIVKTEKKTF